MKILLLNSENTIYGTGGAFIYKLSQILAKYVEVEYIHLAEENPLKALQTIVSQQYDIIMTYNRTVLSDSVRLDHKTFNLLSLTNKPHICFLVDHPCVIYDQLKVVNPMRHMVFCSPGHYYFKEHAKLSGSCSHMIWGGDPVDPTNIYPHHLRPYDIVVAATWKDLKTTIEHHKMLGDGLIEKFVEIVLQRLDADPFRDSYQATMECLDLFEASWSIEEKIEFCTVVVRYIRDRERSQFIEDLVASGVKVLLIGSGWEHYITQKYPNHQVTFKDSVPREKLLENYKLGKIVACLNSTNGACERVFDSLNAGAMVVTEYSPFLWEAFKDSNSILFYSAQTRESSIQELVNIVSIGSEATEYYAKLSIDVMNKAHTWEHRARDIVTLCAQLLEQ